ncbi:hypothetical protein CCM_06501 [Cordyceps militaris CM01]|uniref:Uncharacterized protein n=1 Tax=Cordyceps militaris (strain CM01) TaxID=983644 RepID=G3JMP5_CORMM|nr:uncharacterized protein CCM_06501 [Cordyceps militaris CM01]EGX90081.1 hypothetical protein CCM_06501 [Cordyceps militaris CM01]
MGDDGAPASSVVEAREIQLGEDAIRRWYYGSIKSNCFLSYAWSYQHDIRAHPRLQFQIRSYLEIKPFSLTRPKEPLSKSRLGHGTFRVLRPQPTATSQRWSGDLNQLNDPTTCKDVLSTSSNNNNQRNMGFISYSDGVLAADVEQKNLHSAMCCRPNNHTTTGAEFTPNQYNTPPPSYESICPPPSYDSLSPPPPSYDSLPPPPPAYELLPPPPPYDSLPPPPPPYSVRASSNRTCTTCSSSRPTLPPVSTLLSSIDAAPSSYSTPPPYTPVPVTTTAPRFPVFHARYHGTSNYENSCRDRHKLFILTNADAANPRARGIYLAVTGNRRRGLRVRETLGDVPENTRGLRESILLGSIVAEDIDALGNICHHVQLDRFPVLAGRTMVMLQSYWPHPHKNGRR